MSSIRAADTGAMSRQEWRRGGQVLVEFQSVMARFLDTEREVLTAYQAARRVVDSTASPPLVASGAASHARPGIVPAGNEERSAGSAPVRSQSHLPNLPTAVPWTSSATAVHAEPIGGSPLLRLTVRPTSRPLTGARASLARDHVVLITDDGRGVAGALTERLRAVNIRAAILRTAGSSLDATDIYTGSVQTLEEAEHAVQAISSSCGPIAALIHLQPLNAVPEYKEIDGDVWRERLRHDTRGLFVLSKALASSLDTAAASGGALVLAVTGMGGAFASDSAQLPVAFFPGHGGVVGFTKSLASEWPRVRVRAVDVDVSESPDSLAECLFDEIWAAETELEVGYARGARISLAVTAAPPNRSDGFVIPSDAVILATGGARGITAEICLELAERYQPTLVLVGQTPLPEGMELADTAGLTAPADLKRALLTRLSRDGSRPNIAMVEKAYRHLLREREIRHNLGALTSAGARVHYVPLDIRDGDAFKALLTDIYSTYGRLDGVIHGAGIIEDKLVKDKSLDSFDRVFETKTASAFVLSRHVRPESLRFAVFFSSVAGRFGNRGQSDYAAANEVVNKVTVMLQQQWPGRVCSINWAPWDKHGMVSPELKREFMQRGVGLIDPPAGRRAFWEEIQQRPSDPAEIVVAASANAALAPDRPLSRESTRVASPEKAALMKAAIRQDVVGGALYDRMLAPAIDEYLNDHRLDGRPVLPLAFATEMMAQAAQATWPNLQVLYIRDLQLLKGIAVEDTAVPLTIAVRARASATAAISADVEISTPSLSPVMRYRAVVELASNIPPPPPFQPPDTNLSLLPISLAEAYRSWTFHGPAFQRLTGIDGMSSNAIVARLHSPSTAPGVRNVARADWVIDPFVFDCGLQALLIWSRACNGKTALPSRFRSFRRFGALSDIPVTCFVRVESLSGGHALRSDVYFLDPSGRVLGILEGMEASCTAALNRLSGAGAVPLAGGSR